MTKPDYDTSLARLAGNIASGLVSTQPWPNPSMSSDELDRIAADAVALASRIVNRVRALAPQEPAP